MSTIVIDRAVVKQALEAMLHFPGDISDEMFESIRALKAALATPVPHGCHVDLEEGMKPDGCVLDEGQPEDCVYAKRLFRGGKDKTACEYWKPIEVQR